MDYSTGHFFGQVCSSEQSAIDLCKRINVKEVISYPGQFAAHGPLDDFLQREAILKSIIAQDYFFEKNTKSTLEKFIPNYKQDQIIKDLPQILYPLSALCSFVELTQKPDRINHLSSFKLNNIDENFIFQIKL